MRALTFLTLLLLPPTSLLNAQAPDLPSIVRSGLDAYKQAGVEAALTAWFKESPIASQTAPAVKGTLQQIEATYGSIIGYDVIRVVPLGPHASRSYVVILYQRGPLYFWFDSYKPGDRWIITALLFNTRADSILPRSTFDLR